MHYWVHWLRFKKDEKMLVSKHFIMSYKLFCITYQNTISSSNNSFYSNDYSVPPHTQINILYISLGTCITYLQAISMNWWVASYCSSPSKLFSDSILELVSERVHWAIYLHETLFHYHDRWDVLSSTSSTPSCTRSRWSWSRRHYSVWSWARWSCELIIFHKKIFCYLQKLILLHLSLTM